MHCSLVYSRFLPMNYITPHLNVWGEVYHCFTFHPIHLNRYVTAIHSYSYFTLKIITLNIFYILKRIVRYSHRIITSLQFRHHNNLNVSSFICPPPFYPPSLYFPLPISLLLLSPSLSTPIFRPPFKYNNFGFP